MVGSPRKGVRDARCREVMMAARNNTHAYTVPRILTDVVTITNMQAAHIIHSSETILLIRGDTAHGGADTSLDWGLKGATLRSSCTHYESHQFSRVSRTIMTNISTESKI